MPAPIDPNTKAAIEQAYINSNLTPAELAEQFDVSDRSIKNWAKEGGWDAKRKASKIIQLDTARQSQPRENPRSIPRINPDELPSIEIVNQAIADLHGDMANAIAKDKAQIANALRGLLEYREKLQPSSVDDLANLVIDQLEKWGLSARDFAIRLKQRQEERKRA